MSAARPGENLSEIKCPAPVAGNLIKNGEFVESYLGFRWRNIFKKPPPRAGRGGDGFSQHETTDVPMWPRPKTYSRRKKPPLPTEIVTDYG
jgi:hypothetical protein